MSPAERRVAYARDITYGTNNEFGFDYLRDNTTTDISECVQREHNYAIVDEVDSILVDEARTPLIISGPAEDSQRWYVEMANLASVLEPRFADDKIPDNAKPVADYEVDEKKRTVAILERGIEKVEDHLGIDNLYESANTPLISYLNNAMKAKDLFKRDKDYVVMNGEVLIVDEHTGRTLHGRRYNEGLHQAIEAKEKVEIKEEYQTLATITLQNYFRGYDKLAGMTGTAMTEAAEFSKIYNLGVVPIPTNKPMIREDQRDLIYRTEDAKFDAVVDDIVARHEKGQPILVGTTSVEKSERLSAQLKRRGVRHEVLNAKQHAREAAIVAEAGRKGAVTVATNMAGRGTDIILGGNPEFLADQYLRAQGIDPAEHVEEYEAAYPDTLERFEKQVKEEQREVTELGGLYVLGTERHESRRIDNQLRGRSGRQGDPGESRFYLSLGDELMRLFASDRIGKIMDRFNWPEDEPIQAKLVTRAIETAQKNVEEQNFEIRKNVLKYDEVMNTQRKVIYGERRKILEGRDLKEEALEYVSQVVQQTVGPFVSKDIYPEEWDLDGLITALSPVYPTQLKKADIEEIDSAEEVLQLALEDAFEAYEQKERDLGTDQSTDGPILRELERMVLLSIIDNKWREHLYEMDYLQEGIGLRAYGQRDPLVEYQREAFDMFQEMKAAIQEEFVRYIYRVELVRQDEPARPRPQRVQLSHGDEGAAGAAAAGATSVGDKIPRNAPCPCGSGKKYKKCHGMTA